MNLKFYIPPNKGLVFDSIRLAYGSNDEKKIITTPPFGKPVLILFLNPNSVNNYHHKSKGVLLGQHTQPLFMDLNENYKVIAIHLKPYALKELLNINASDLTNKFISVDNISLFQELYELILLNIENEKSLINEIINFFNNAIRYPISFEVKSFLEYIEKKDSNSISEITNKIGITERNLERKFKTEVGLSPKKYLQIQRVFKVFEKLEDKPDWQNIVYEFNYSDQAHLINEFKKYANIAPGLYVKQGLTISKQLPPISKIDI